MKDIKDYLHLYLGCEISDASNDNFIVCDSLNPWYLNYLYESTRLKDFRLVLRPLSDMTEEEKDDFADHGYDFEDDGELPVNIWKGVNMSGHVLWLLSKGFDIFGLIEAGLAINKTKMQPHDASSSTSS